MERCATCGQIIGPELTVDERRIPRSLQIKGTIRQRLYSTLRKGPRTADQLRAIVWREDPDGPPFSALYVHIFKLNRFLLRHGMAVRCNSSTHEYRLVTIEDE
jgi:hypothetical protein